MYLLTTCATCAAPLDSKGAKQCSRCKTRYCSAICQREHWARGGHDSLCKKIKKGGGAEEYHADTIYARARAAVALPLLKNKRYDEGYRDHLREAVHDLMGLSDAVVEWEQWEQYDSIRDTLRLALTHQLDWSLEDLDLSPSQAEHYMYASDDD